MYHKYVVAMSNKHNFHKLVHKYNSKLLLYIWHYMHAGLLSLYIEAAAGGPYLQEHSEETTEGISGVKLRIWGDFTP